MKLDFRQRLLATTLMVGASLLASPAFAQETPTNEPAPGTPPDTSGPVESQAPAAMQESVAQEAPQPEEPGRDIVVTGTRIPSANLESASPVTVVGQQDIQLSGTTRIEDVLNSLPSVGASQASGMANGASGTAEVDLRYLGSKRTLALINGRRMTPGDPATTTQAADLNFIPSSLVKRVEVLTGGASSVYGADAVAGVVNFIMDTNFEGIRFDGQYSFYQHNNTNPNVAECVGVSATQLSCAGKTPGDMQTVKDINAARGYTVPSGSVADGGAFDGTMSIGVKFDDDRGHAVAYFGYRNVNPVLQSRRDFSNCTIQNTGSGSPRCGGSATANPGNGFIFTHLNSTTSTTAALGPGTVAVGGPQNLYNFAPLNYFQRPDERYIGGVFADYEISKAIHPYLEFMFMDDHTLAQIAPSGDFFNTNTINCDNPFMSTVPGSGGIASNPNASVQESICNDANLVTGFIGNFPVAAGAPYNTPANGVGSTTPLDFVNTDPNSPGTTFQKAFMFLARRNTEGGPRIADLTHTSYRGVVGSKGDLGNVWSYDAYYQYGRTNYNQVYKNEFSAARLAKALDAVVDTRPTSPTFGQPVCRSVLDGSDLTCQPYDVFGARPSAASIDYLNVSGNISGRTSEQIVHADFTGTLGEYGIKFPWAEDGVGVNIGTEYRKEKLVLDPDELFQAGDLTGQGAPTLPVNGSFRVIEFFGEAQLPVIQNSFIQELTLGAGYRKSYYELSSGRKYNTNTYKLSFEFAPIRDVRLRGAYNRAVRAPNIQELFAPQFVGLDGTKDPCAGHTILPTEYGCIASGLPAGTGTPPNPAGQYNGLLGGVPTLEPEKATTKTLGVVLQPSFLPRLALTIDYWNIKLEKAIQGFGADAIITACINQSTATFDSPACALINRSVPGSLWLTPDGFINDLPNNDGRIKTNGIDINSSYSRRIGNIGTLSTSFNGTYLMHYKVNNGLTEEYDCAGLYGPTCSGQTVASGAPMPKWRSKSRWTLTMPNGVGVSLAWRHVGKVKAETLEDNESIGGATTFDPGLHIKAQNYLDLATTYTFGDHYNFRLGVNNIFDNDPPLVTSGNGAIDGTNLCPTGPCNGNTYPGTWDALGRYVYAGVTLDF
jgi:iron complex outermembrane receptor protein